MIILLIFILLVTVAELVFVFTESKEVGSTLFSPKKGDKYVQNRIPGIIVTKKGTVITYFEGRTTRGDWAVMDIIAYRDDGENRTEILLADGASEGKTVNNPVMVEDKNGRIHFLYCVNYGVGKGGGVFRRYSDDDGQNWSEVIDITASTAPESRNVFATGPGHGICLKNGRLIVPVWYVEKASKAEEKAHHPAEVATLFSDDDGESWSIGEKVPSGFSDANETAAVELSDGRVMLNVRVTDTGKRGFSISENGYSNWSILELDENLNDPTCFGSIAAYGEGKERRLYFVNCDSRAMRINLTVKVSEDDGRTWSHSRRIDSGITGYSDIAVDGEGRILIVYEKEGGKKARIVAIDEAWIRSGSTPLIRDFSIIKLALAAVIGALATAMILLSVFAYRK